MTVKAASSGDILEQLRETAEQQMGEWLESIKPTILLSGLSWSYYSEVANCDVWTEVILILFLIHNVVVTYWQCEILDLLPGSTQLSSINYISLFQKNYTVKFTVLDN